MLKIRKKGDQCVFLEVQLLLRNFFDFPSNGCGISYFCYKNQKLHDYASKAAVSRFDTGPPCFL